MIHLLGLSRFSGTIRVVYQARAGNVNDLTAGQSLATAGTDFSTIPLETILDDGQQSAVITMDILEVATYLAHKINVFIFLSCFDS